MHADFYNCLVLHQFHYVAWLMQDTIKFFFRGGAYTLADILPQRFGPANLLTNPDAPLLLQPQHHNLELTAGAPTDACWTPAAQENMMLSCGPAIGSWIAFKLVRHGAMYIHQEAYRQETQAATFAQHTESLWLAITNILQAPGAVLKQAVLASGINRSYTPIDIHAYILQ